MAAAALARAASPLAHSTTAAPSSDSARALARPRPFSTTPSPAPPSPPRRDPCLPPRPSDLDPAAGAPVHGPLRARDTPRPPGTGAGPRGRDGTARGPDGPRPPGSGSRPRTPGPGAPGRRAAWHAERGSRAAGRHGSTGVDLSSSSSMAPRATPASSEGRPRAPRPAARRVQPIGSAVLVHADDPGAVSRDRWRRTRFARSASAPARSATVRGAAAMSPATARRPGSAGSVRARPGWPPTRSPHAPLRRLISSVSAGDDLRTGPRPARSPRAGRSARRHPC